MRQVELFVARARLLIPFAVLAAMALVEVAGRRWEW